MLSIGAMQGGQAGYYLALAQEDYYLAGGEPPGAWLGTGSERLGLAGVVNPQDLTHCFQGNSHDGSKLVQNAGKANRQPGWDLTFSAPKSVSVAWSQASQVEQLEIREAHAAAVGAAVKFLEDNYAHSRIGKGGTEQVKAGLVVASFEHSCSRALDPQLHTHCLVMNLGVDAAGNARSLLSKPLYEAKMLAGAFYRCELAAQLQRRLGVTLETPVGRDGRPVTWFELKGVPEPLLKHFSKRRAAIEKELGAQGMESASAAAFAALATREAKQMIPPRQELHDGWKREGRELGFSVDGLFRPASDRSLANVHAQYRTALAESLAAITFSENFFTKDELTRRTLEAAQELGIPATAVPPAIEADLHQLPTFVPLGMRNGTELWTTSEVLSVEKEFLESVGTLKARTFTGVSDAVVHGAINKVRGGPGGSFTLDDEQKEAVRYLTQGKESVKVITGFAGTGKTDMLSAAREAWEKAGYTVIGTALAGVAARTLQEKAGIQSDTVRMRELQLHRDLKHTLQHHAKQLVRAALGKKTYALSHLTIDAKTVLVVDEAGMVGTRDFALLAKAVVDHGGSLVVVGDQWQLSSIERGGCLGSLTELIEGIHLSQIRRQEDAGDREAVLKILDGDPEAALKHYAQKGQFFVERSNEKARQKLIDDWAASGGAEKPHEHRIFASTHADVNRFNELAQWKRVQAGQVDVGQYVQHDETRFMVGDAVRFNQSDRSLGIKKGETGTVIACKDGHLGKYVAVQKTVEVKTLSQAAAAAIKHHARQLLRAAMGKRTEKLPKRTDIVVVPLKTLIPTAKAYSGLRLDYCMTTHLGQGQTVRNAYVHLGGNMTDRELSYVQASRHKEKLLLYSDEKAAGFGLTKIAREHRHDEPMQTDDAATPPDYSALASQMKLSRAKELAMSVQAELRHQPLDLKPRR